MIDTFEKTYTDWSIDVGTYKYEHIELSVTNDGDRGAIIYGKNELGHQEVLQIIEDFVAHQKVPALDDWEIVLDLRPKMESL